MAHPILTNARLDRIADMQRDLGAVATALHYDRGYTVEDAVRVATDAFEAGKTVREWLASAEHDAL
jgi:predicted transcriptional regulator